MCNQCQECCERYGPTCTCHKYCVGGSALCICCIVFLVSLISLVAGGVLIGVGTGFIAAMQIPEGTAMKIVGYILLIAGAVLFFCSLLSNIGLLCVQFAMKGKDDLFDAVGITTNPKDEEGYDKIDDEIDRIKDKRKKRGRKVKKKDYSKRARKKRANARIERKKNERDDHLKNWGFE